MCRIVDELASEKGILPDEANYIFVGITSVLVTKMPELRPVLEAIFEECDEDKLQEHIGKMATMIQEQQWKEKFKHHQMLHLQNHVVIPTGGGILF